ncbi:MAG: hypothetical protein JW790_06410, partial [Dehalococcoidales bacterium]|nr:hypothetical protein [Dehalococcoidales bacterium]
LPRPSSALDTKASTMCLNRLTCFRIDIRLRIQLLKCYTRKNGLAITHQAVAWSLITVIVPM